MMYVKHLCRKSSHDRFVNELEEQFDSMSHLQTVFVGSSSQAILEDTEGELERKFRILGSEYGVNLDVSRLLFEVLRLRDFLRQRDMTMMTNHRLSNGWDGFNDGKFKKLPNIVIALRLFFMSTVSVASTERSFSKLKLSQSYLKSSVSQDCLSNLSFISSEHETVEKIDFDQVISNFASAKAWKIKIW